MEPEVLAHRANQVALFFAAYPHAEAVEGVADHFKKFWEPRIRKQLIEYVAADGVGLHALVSEAVKRLG